MFVRLYVRHIRGIYDKAFYRVAYKFLKWGISHKPLIRKHSYLDHRYPGGSAFIPWLMTPGSMPQGGARGQNLEQLLGVFFYFSVMETNAYSWSDIAQSCDIDLWVMKWRSAWPSIDGQVILPYILKTIWCIYIILWDYESVWPEVWPQNKCRSLWPIFYGPVILPLKTIWCMNIIISDYESVSPDIWLQNKCRSLWPIFHGPVILPYILKTIRCMYIIIWDYESVWPEVWPQNKCRWLWPIFYVPVILPCISVTHRLTLPSICRTVTYIFWSSNFDSYLED